MSGEAAPSQSTAPAPASELLDLAPEYAIDGPVVAGQIAQNERRELVIPDVSRDVRSEDIADFRLSIIAPALAYPKRSKARKQCIEEQASRTHRNPVTGREERYRPRILRHWIEKYEPAQSREALKNKHRKARGRVLVSRAWDLACPLDLETKVAISTDLRYHVMGLWRIGMGGARLVAEHASTWLMTQCRSRGWPGAELSMCQVRRRWVEQPSVKVASELGIRERDAKLDHDIFTPRVRRSRDGYWPFEIVVYDVHPMDILVRCEDGTTQTARLICWLDVATGLVRADVKFPRRSSVGKKETVNQIDITGSFVSTCVEWGIPKHLQEDNGKENLAPEWREAYKELFSLARASRSIGNDPGYLREAGSERDSPFITSKPNRPTGKMIEGFFKAFENMLRHLPGHIGGDRMNKKTHAMGKEPYWFPGTEGQFHELVQNTLKAYNARPQRGHLSGRSPAEMLAELQKQRETAEGAFRPFKVGREELVWAFAKERKVEITRFGIDLGGRNYWHDDLAPPGMLGQRVSVRHASWNPEYLFARLPGPEEWTMVPEYARHGYADPAGAKEQGRRVGVRNSAMRDLKKIVPKLNPIQVTRDHAASLQPLPSIQHGPSIEINAEASASFRRAAIEAPSHPPSKPEVGPLERYDPRTGKVLRLVPDAASAASVFQPQALPSSTGKQGRT